MDIQQYNTDPGKNVMIDVKNRKIVSSDNLDRAEPNDQKRTHCQDTSKIQPFVYFENTVCLHKVPEIQNRVHKTGQYNHSTDPLVYWNQT